MPATTASLSVTLLCPVDTWDEPRTKCRVDAFDAVPDPHAATCELVDLGLVRIRVGRGNAELLAFARAKILAVAALPFVAGTCALPFVGRRSSSLDMRNRLARGMLGREIAV